MNEVYKVAREIVNPINAVGDKTGAKLENGIVTPSPGFKEAYKFLQQNGWGSSSECIKIETGMPLILYKAVSEINQAACPALTSYIKLTSGAANLILRFGTEKDESMFLQKMLNGEWQGTMCLTEPNFGSDVGDITTRAYLTDDPRIYKIKGTKMFITGGDGGHCTNTIHMVLARPEGGAPGSAGHRTLYRSQNLGQRRTRLLANPMMSRQHAWSTRWDSMPRLRRSSISAMTTNAAESASAPRRTKKAIPRAWP